MLRSDGPSGVADAHFHFPLFEFTVIKAENGARCIHHTKNKTSRGKGGLGSGERENCLHQWPQWAFQQSHTVKRSPLFEWKFSPFKVGLRRKNSVLRRWRANARAHAHPLRAPFEGPPNTCCSRGGRRQTRK